MKEVKMDGDAFARSQDPIESKMAASALQGEVASELEMVVLRALAANPEGLSSHGICRVTGLSWGSATPRIKPLRVKRLVESREKDGKPIRRFDTNQPSKVWFITELGKLLVAGR